ncbi:hypothetical protein D3C83_60480 [compost metagenome]
MTVFFPPANRTRLPLRLGCSPSPASMMPALTSSSLYLPISASSFSPGMMPASEFFVALTMTMTRIACAPSRYASTGRTSDSPSNPGQCLR